MLQGGTQHIDHHIVELSLFPLGVQIGDALIREYIGAHEISEHLGLVEQLLVFRFTVFEFDGDLVATFDVDCFEYFPEGSCPYLTDDLEMASDHNFHFCTNIIATVRRCYKLVFDLWLLRNRHKLLIDGRNHELFDEIISIL